MSWCGLFDFHIALFNFAYPQIASNDHFSSLNFCFTKSKYLLHSKDLNFFLQFSRFFPYTNYLYPDNILVHQVLLLFELLYLFLTHFLWRWMLYEVLFLSCMLNILYYVEVEFVFFQNCIIFHSYRLLVFLFCDDSIIPNVIFYGICLVHFHFTIRIKYKRSVKSIDYIDILG